MIEVINTSNDANRGLVRVINMATWQANAKHKKKLHATRMLNKTKSECPHGFRRANHLFIFLFLY